MRKSLEALGLMAVSSVIALALGAVRTKVIAVELGTVGIGSFGVLSATVSTLATALGCGLGVSSISLIATSLDDGARMAGVRRALRRGIYVLALMAGLLGWLFWTWWARGIAGGSLTSLAPWVGVAAAATILATRYPAVLSGVGRVRHLAAANVAGAVVATALLLGSIPFSHLTILATAISAPPVGLVVTGAVVSRLVTREPRPPSGPRWAIGWSELLPMLKLGLVVASSAVMVSGSQLFASSWITQTLGIENNGLFQASWAIAGLYLVFMLSALTAEYLPRLARLRHDRRQMEAAVNEQVQLLVLLAVPVIAWLIVVSPILLEVLYSPSFRSAAHLLQIQLVGDVLKVLGWTLAFILLARQARLRFFLGELSWNASFIALTAAFAHRGLAAVGVAYTTAYAVYLGVTVAQTRFRPTARTLAIVASAITGLVATYALASWAGADTSLAAGLLAAAITGLVGLEMWRTWKGSQASRHAPSDPA